MKPECKSLQHAGEPWLIIFRAQGSLDPFAFYSSCCTIMGSQRARSVVVVAIKLQEEILG